MSSAVHIRFIKKQQSDGSITSSLKSKDQGPGMEQNNTGKVVWCITDGKLGHMKQVRGLVQAMAKQVHVRAIEIRAQSAWYTLQQFMQGQYLPGDQLPAPDLIIGAGHGTHLNMLAAQRAHGGKTVVLMKPSLPRQWFDLCLVPDHDGVNPASNIITTHGVLTQVAPTTIKNSQSGLILLGGISKHFDWENGRLVLSIHRLVRETRDVQWQLTMSPRTPAATLEAIQRLRLPNLTLMPMHQTPSGWLEKQLEPASQVWVTPDSVSMVYEALTAGCSVGVFNLKAKRSSRVVRGLEKLRENGWVTCYRKWRPGTLLPQMTGKIDEAGRCALWIKHQWFQNA